VLNGSAEAGVITSQVKISALKLVVNLRIQNLSAANFPARSKFHRAAELFGSLPTLKRY
jgi:hypothetical protein